jgi:hypothetical protein
MSTDLLIIFPSCLRLGIRIFNIFEHCFWNGIRVRHVLTTLTEKFKILKHNYLLLKDLNVKKIASWSCSFNEAKQSKAIESYYEYTVYQPVSS